MEAVQAIQSPEPKPYDRRANSDSRFWTDERVETLKQLWADGLSASTIQARMGACSRSAVIGKVHRLGLSGRKRMGGTPRPVVEKRRKMRQRVIVPVRAQNYGSGMSRAEYRKITIIDNGIVSDFEIQDAQRRTLSQLEHHHCRWPVGNPGEPDFFFCGADAVEGASSNAYCARHYCVAYQKTDRRIGHCAGDGNMKLPQVAA